MASLDDDFKELMERIRQGRELGHMSYEPIYYLIFHPRHILKAKRDLPAWTARLRNDGWEALRFSIAGEVADILLQAPPRRIWLSADRNFWLNQGWKSPADWDKTNQALAGAIVNGALTARLEALLEQQQGKRNAIVLVTDLEGLHPYTRIGAIESQLYGKFAVPTVFFYPGERTGKTRLKFLGFYPDDGNYRSVHVGG